MSIGKDFNLSDLNRYFKKLYNYELKEDSTFYAKDNSGSTVNELVEIISTLDSMRIKYSIDENYNIKVDSN